MSAARFNERNVIRTLILQGIEVRCYRTKQIITLETVDLVEREHLVPTGLGGENTPWNCRYSLKAEHAKQTYGVGTSGWSDRKMIDKADRIRSGGKTVRNPMPKMSEAIKAHNRKWKREQRARIKAERVST